MLQKNGGTDTKAMGQTEPQFLSDPMSDRKKKVFANSECVVCVLSTYVCLFVLFLLSFFNCMTSWIILLVSSNFSYSK